MGGTFKLSDNHARIEKAIRCREFKGLAHQEDEKTLGERPAKTEWLFHQGKSGDWRDPLTPNSVSTSRTMAK